MKYKINYKLTIDNGELVDKAQNFEFETLDGQLAPALENCITHSNIKGLQTLLLNGTDIFGEHIPSRLIEIDKNTLPKNYEIDSAIDFDLPNGEKVIGVVKKIKEKLALIDFNHPLSKCSLAFSFEILESYENTTC